MVRLLQAIADGLVAEGAAAVEGFI